MEVDHQAALRVATEAALAAGEILREEFHRPGGPRGRHGHCPADLEAERAIRVRLEPPFPGWGYRGEETGEKPAANPNEPIWLVDPNDGTSAFLQGTRGSAVSIALLREGRPVLGVVHAFAAPDGGGDLFAWAEGCGPLRRNGREIPPPAWPPALEASHAVLLSQGADTNPEANLRCVSPARYRAVPSIAYRLALVATGEGVAAVSLNGPGDWDYAGGHALLRSAGGALVGQDLRPVVYDPNGRSRTTFCFGGAPTVVADLAGRPWDQVFRRPPLQGSGSDLPFPVRLLPGGALRDAGPVSRAHGCLLGQLAGDSLGGLVEFEGRDSPWWELPGGPRLLRDGGHYGLQAGQPTDDSELALMLARRDSSLTHPNPVCQEACAALTVAVARAVGRGGTPGEVYDFTLAWARSNCREPAVLAHLEEAASRPPEDYRRRQGWVLVAFQNAFYRLLHASTVEDGVVETLLARGDTDTNAAIAGALLGAVHGREAVPEQWRQGVLSCRPLRGLSPTRHPRPYPFWPVDALELSERLAGISPSASS